MRNLSPNEILKIPRDASTAEIVAAVTARTAHFRELSTDESVQALSEIYQAAAFLLWETKHAPEARTASVATGVSTTPPSHQRRVPARHHRQRRRNGTPSWAPLLIVAPTLAALAVFLLYPDATMSAAWKLVDRATASREFISSTPDPTSSATHTPTLPVIPTASSDIVAPASTSHSEPAATSASVPTLDTQSQSQPLLRVCVTISSLNVRTGPGAAYPSNSYLLEGECVDLVAQNQAGTWGLIRSAPRPAAESGWAALAYLKSDGSLDTLPVVTPPSVPSQTP